MRGETGFSYLNVLSGKLNFVVDIYLFLVLLVVCRFEVRSLSCQYTDFGFAITGLSTLLGGRIYAKAKEMSFSYNIQDGRLVNNYTTPSTNVCYSVKSTLHFLHWLLSI